MAVINNFEIYANRKEEIVARVFGVIDPGHPYISHIYSGGDWLIGGEIQLLDRIRYESCVLRSLCWRGHVDICVPVEGIATFVRLNTASAARRPHQVHPCVFLNMDK